MPDPLLVRARKLSQPLIGGALLHKPALRPHLARVHTREHWLRSQVMATLVQRSWLWTGIYFYHHYHQGPLLKCNYSSIPRPEVVKRVRPDTKTSESPKPIGDVTASQNAKSNISHIHDLRSSKDESMGHSPLSRYNSPTNARDSISAKFSRH
jgi:hypothetical protein